MKKPSALLWSRGYGRNEIDDLLAKGKIDETWLICPFGNAERAVPFSRFLKDTSVFSRMAKMESVASSSVERPVLRTWGKWLVGIAAVYMLVGRKIVRHLFPHWSDQGLGPDQLAVLIPFWTIGSLGILMWIFGAAQQKSRISQAIRQARADIIAGR